MTAGKRIGIGIAVVGVAMTSGQLLQGIYRPGAILVNIGLSVVGGNLLFQGLTEMWKK